MISASRSIRGWRAGAFAMLFASIASAQGLEEFKKKLADSNQEVRRGAVEGLAHQNGPEALELVLKCLRDPSAMVADQAELALASADDEAELELVFGKDGLAAKEDLVRLRCAEAIGRIDAKLTSARLAKALSDKNPMVRRAMAYSIEQLAARLSIVENPAVLLRKELSGLADRDSVSGVRAACVMSLMALAPGLTQAELASFAVDKAFEVRSAALLAAGKLELPVRLELSKQGLKDANASVRLQAVALLETVANRDAVIRLADALELEKGLHATWAIVESLRRLSGLKAGRDARYWQQWAKGLAVDWKPSPAGSKPANDAEKTVTFVGLPLLSDRITFLIDLSGSMWEERDGKTRKAGADKELERALSGLTPAVEFNLIPFTTTPIPWQAALQAATPKNVAAALAFFVKRSDHGKGNFWDALQLALEDPNVDTLVLLGDGAPTGGTRWNLGLMRKLFDEQNRFRLVTLDAVLVDSSRFLTETWTAWCESSGGQTRATDLR